MNYGNCAICGKATGYNSVRICANCKEKEFNRVKDYLNEYGKTNINQISIDLKLPKKLLFEFVIEGRLDASDIGKEEIDKVIDEDRRKHLLSELNTLNQTNTNQSKKIIIEDSSKKNMMRFLNRR